MDLGAFMIAEFDAHQKTLDATRERVGEPFIRLVGICADSIRSGGKIVFFGNGGSAADAQHLATELTVRYKQDRPPIAGLALTTDSSALTAICNDTDFADMFARQIESLCRPGDVAIGISTSGNSANVNRGLEMARRMDVTAAGFCGKSGGVMTELADPFILIPSDDTARIQEMHITIGHMLCGALEKELGLL